MICGNLWYPLPRVLFVFVCLFVCFFHLFHLHRHVDVYFFFEILCFFFAFKCGLCGFVVLRVLLIPVSCPCQAGLLGVGCGIRSHIGSCGSRLLTLFCTFFFQLSLYSNMSIPPPESSRLLWGVTVFPTIFVWTRKGLIAMTSREYNSQPRRSALNVLLHLCKKDPPPPSPPQVSPFLSVAHEYTALIATQAHRY
jgi:hypothetical protein